MAALKVGDTAPDFELPAITGKERRKFKLSDFRGKKNVLLAFYPLDWSPTCTTEMSGFKTDLSKFSGIGAEVVGVSVDSLYSHIAWQEKAIGGDYTLASDFWPHGEVARSYGVFDDTMGVAIRGTFIIDKEGVVRWKVVNPIPQAREIADYQKALAELS
jgi:alkyl hydroperoxide reductase subunit AhpC